MNQDENRESPSEAEVEALVQKAIRDITLAASEAVAKSAKEAEEAARKPPKFKPLESFDVNGQRVEIQQRSLDGYLENRKMTMELEPKPRTVQAARLFQDVDDFWGGPSNGPNQILPFQIYTRGQDLVAAPGTIRTTSIPEQVVENPASGDWYFEVRVAIDGLDGSITTAVGEWVQTPSSIYSNTEKSLTLGNITVVAGVPDLSSLQQYNFGPILVAIYGGVTERWNIEIY